MEVERERERKNKICCRKCECGRFWFFNHLPERDYIHDMLSLSLITSLSLFRLLAITLLVWIKCARTKTGYLLEAWANPIFGERSQPVHVICVDRFDGLFQFTLCHNRCADNNQILIFKKMPWCAISSCVGIIN